MKIKHPRRRLFMSSEEGGKSATSTSSSNTPTSPLLLMAATALLLACLPRTASSYALFPLSSRSSAASSAFVLRRSFSSSSSAHCAVGEQQRQPSALFFAHPGDPHRRQEQQQKHNYCLVSPWINRLRGGSSAASFSSSSSSGSSKKKLAEDTRLRSTAAEEATTTSTPEVAEGEAADTMTSAEKLERLRARMKELDLDVYLVPSDDPHLSEYVPSAYMRRAYLSHFKGSAGTAVVTADDGAYLWTDSRYWNEAGLQLDGKCWELVKAGLPATPTIPKWLAERAVKHYKDGGGKALRVGIDPFVHAAAFAKEVQDAFKESATQELDDGESAVIGELVTVSNPNLVDEIWGDDRPPIPTSPFRVHPAEYAGASVADKVSKIRKEMEEKKATMAVFTTLDDVAYLLNVRAKGDVETCPVGIAYAAITADDVRLYCDPKKVEAPDVRNHLEEVTLLPYDAIIDDVKAHCETKGNKVWLDKGRSNYGLSSLVPDSALVDATTAVTHMKACKNEAEMEGMRKAHVVDGVAMAKFVAWLEDKIVNKGDKVSEVEIDLKLTGYRAEQPGFVEVSFPTIAGVGPNGAIIHYRASEDSDILKYLDSKTPILIDSGGQYLYGTTDVTRTWYFGEKPDPEFVEMYTRVLKGNIGMDEMVFPEDTPGFVLDVYARRWLWDAQKDYGHGTGHGVGAALNVHEGPQSISPRFANKEGLKRGMVVSNEPGYYVDGQFGIRIENLLEIQYVNPEDNVEEVDGEEKKEGKKFLKFAKLTMIPIQKNLIDVSLMTTRELDWLDEYHSEVFAKVSPHLEPDSPEMKWLKKSCEKIDRQQ